MKNYSKTTAGALRTLCEGRGEFGADWMDQRAPVTERHGRKFLGSWGSMPPTRGGTVLERGVLFI